MPPEVRAVLYKGPGVHGDFTTMIQRDKYKDTLFIISENLRDMFYSSEVGGGTAQLRLHCYGHHDPQDQRPRAAGIPTGWTSLGGFPRLSRRLRPVHHTPIRAPRRPRQQAREGQLRG